MTTVPDLVVGSRLVDPLVRGMQQLNEVRVEATRLVYNSVLQRGGIVLAVAAVENALADSLRYFLSARPTALRADAIDVHLRQLLHAERSYDHLKQFIEARVRRLSYQAFPEQLKRYTTILGIEAPAQDLVDAYIEINETRNLIAHSDMQASEQYIRRSGKRSRVRRGQLVPVTQEYLVSALVICHSLLDTLRSHLLETYGENSHLAALRRLWAWMLPSPVLKFEDYWEIDEEEDLIVAYREPDTARLASSERMILALWLAQAGYASPHHPLVIRSLDGDNRRRVSYFMALLDDFDLN